MQLYLIWKVLLLSTYKNQCFTAKLVQRLTQIILLNQVQSFLISGSLSTILASNNVNRRIKHNAYWSQTTLSTKNKPQSNKFSTKARLRRRSITQSWFYFRLHRNCLRDVKDWLRLSVGNFRSLLCLPLSIFSFAHQRFRWRTKNSLKKGNSKRSSEERRKK